MKITINRQIFSDMIKAYSTFAFSDEGITALYEHLCNIERDQKDEIELDVETLCDSFTEYQDGVAACSAHNINLDGLWGIERDTWSVVLLEERTDVIKHDFGIIVKNF